MFAAEMKEKINSLSHTHTSTKILALAV